MKRGVPLPSHVVPPGCVLGVEKAPVVVARTMQAYELVGEAEPNRREAEVGGGAARADLCHRIDRLPPAVLVGSRRDGLPCARRPRHAKVEGAIEAAEGLKLIKDGVLRRGCVVGVEGPRRGGWPTP